MKWILNDFLDSYSTEYVVYVLERGILEWKFY